MHRVFPLVTVLLIPLVACAAWSATCDVQPVALTCELLEDPLGVDAPNPRLSWQLKAMSQELGLVQSAYQIRVARSLAALVRGQGDLWDTGEVRSSECVQVPYGGAPLRSCDDCWWQVRAWDGAGRASAWSRPGRWQMGVLRPEDWQARWITLDPASAEEVPLPGGQGLTNFDGCRWIWAPGANARQDVAAGERYFWRVVEVPDKAALKRVVMLLTVDDRWVLQINGTEVARSGEGVEPWRTPRQVDLTEHMVTGPNVVAVTGINGALSPAGLIGKLVLEAADGDQQTVVTDRSWRVGQQALEGWARSATPPAGFVEAAEMGVMGDGPWYTLRPEGVPAWSTARSSPLLRRSFRLQNLPRRATLSVCGLGFHEARLNGRKVGDHVLEPLFTRYDKRTLYVTFDVTGQLRQGENVLGVMLGNGWLNQHARDAWDFTTAPWRDEPKLIAQLRLEMPDGQVRVLGTDGAWQASTGPMVRDGVRNGEVYDARRELPGWDAPGFDARGWKRAVAAKAPGGLLRSQMMPPNRVVETLRPVAVTEPTPGVFLVDMGQAFAGWAQLRLRGPAGTCVTLRYGERLRPDGRLEQAQITSLVFEGPFQTDQYVMSGQGLEVWEPRFTYHGFRYVEVSGFPGTLTADNVLGRVVHTDYRDAGEFWCSDPALTQIQKLTRWAYGSNFLGYPTDCPHREKNGWTGDAQLACEAGLYLFDQAASYEKWMRDFADEQPVNGELPGIVPTSGWGYGTGPAWDSAYVLIPWYLYVYQGDLAVLREHYPGMKRYVEYLRTRERDGLVDYGLGDWVAPKTQTPTAVTSTGYYYVDALIVSRTARLLGLESEAAEYEALAAHIRESFRRAFYHGDGMWANGSLTALSCALYQGFVDEAERAATLAALARELQSQDVTWDVGILGAKYLPNALTEGGAGELAFQLATQTQAPSYGAWIAQGATTLWEDWYGGASLNHIMFGDITAWFYRSLAGIRPDPAAPGFRHTLIQPLTPAGLEYASARHETPYGTVSSSWQRREGALWLEVIIPPNTTATVHVPGGAGDEVLVGEGPADEAPGVRRAASGEARVYEVGSGRYLFESVPRDGGAAEP